MLGTMFNQIDRLGKGLDASWLRQDVIAQNIANADTPNYKSKRVSFETDFQNALEGGTGFQAKRTRAEHLTFGGASDPMAVLPTVEENSDYTMRMDGNNVDIEQENVALAENTIRYDLLTTKLNAELSRLKLVIREGK
ncbi:MAG: flagellar basal body rod protein FlgB [Oscillospiraceae bacterium]|jgi:flagellar basal-body rod protein FlgB|nr:flagellar basal body rod protein FlgB [Oscillospiraceae bacterium]